MILRCSRPLTGTRRMWTRPQIQLKVSLPADFPDKYVKGIKNFAKICLVSKLAINLDAQSWLVPVVEKREA